MKKFYQLFAAFGLSILAIGATAQSLKSGRVIMSHVDLNTKVGHYSPKKMTSSNTVLINYDSADASLSGGMYYHNQGQLMNTHYVYPGDTVGGNHNLNNYYTVVFDSIVDAYNADAAYTASSVQVDTLVIPIVHNNHSGVADTLEVQINSVDKYGQPTTTVLKDTMIIGVVLGTVNSSNQINNIIVPENYVLSTTSKFAITVKYTGDKKKDSCWYIYGFHYFTGGCPTGSFTLADETTYSTVDSGGWAVVKANAGTKMATVNSWELWPGFSTAYEFPGNLVFIDCNGNGKFDPGIDAANYFENINVFAMVTTNPVGINELAANGFVLAQNAPNPFNRNSQINYNLAKQADVMFTIYDMTGRKLVENNFSNVAPGQHIINLSANQFTPGVYFYSLNVNGNVVTKRMVVTQ